MGNDDLAAQSIPVKKISFKGQTRPACKLHKKSIQQGAVGCGARSGLLYQKDGGPSPDSSRADARSDLRTDFTQPDTSIKDISTPDKNIPDSTSPDTQPSCPSNGKTFNVPGAYSSIPQAIAASQPGDTIKVAAGTYSFLNAKLKYCTNLIGAGKDKTIIEYKFNTSNIPGGYILSASDQCTISNITVRDIPSFQPLPYCASPYFAAFLLEEGKATIKDNSISCLKIKKNATPFVDSNEIHTLSVLGQAKPFVQNNIIVGGGFGEYSSGQLINNTFPSQYGGAGFIGHSYPIVRGNNFKIVDYQGPNGHYGAWIAEYAKPDLGTPANPGNNIFNNQSQYYKYFGYSIENETANSISAYGNFFEQKPNPGGYVFSTYDEMLSHPNPFDISSDITAIKDSHDSQCQTYYGSPCGTVDYSGFKKKP